MTDEELPWLETNEIMSRHDFSYERVRRSHIWAAKNRECPRCGAPPYVACRNLTSLKKFGFWMAKETRSPHTERIDYNRLKQALYDRGYQ